MSDSYRFESCELHVGQRRLFIAGAEATLGVRAFDLLSLLVAQRERPVPKHELLEAVWPGLAVEEGNLPVQISTLRKLLGAQAIATVPGRGYRFMLSVQGDYAPSQALAPLQAGAAEPRLDNLPAAVAPLIGRDGDLAEADAALRQHALLSLVGTGGIGKTRLALAAAQRALSRHCDGVWWVDLADLDDAALIAGRIGLALGLPVERSPEPLQALAQGLRGRELLLVLDNCEHLLDGVATLVRTLLQEAPGVRWLLTTQEPLKLPAEQVLRLGPLPVPPTGTGLNQALRYGAVALLLERARAHSHRYTLNEQDVAVAIAICEQLDGIPLALEMAAARLPWMGLAGVHERLGDRLRLLSSDGRQMASRHRSLQAALQWSHGLLSPTEQRVFRRLALFQGGFTLDGATEVVEDGHLLDRWDAIDAIGVLVDKSMVHLDGDPRAATPRYRLLESTRLFALDLLNECDDLSAAQTRHAQAYGRVAARALQQLWDQSDDDWLAGIESEFDNLRAALAHAVQAGRADLAVDLYEALNWLGVLLSGGLETRRWAERVEALSAGPQAAADPALRARLLQAVGSVHRNHAPARAIELMQQALATSLAALPADGDRRQRFRLHCTLALCHARTGALDLAAQDLMRAQGLRELQWPARLLLLEADAAGFVAVGSDDIELAQMHFNRFQALARQGGVTSALNTVAHNLADIALQLGDAAEAVRQGRTLVSALRRQTNGYHLGFALGNLSAALLQAGEWQAAHATAVEALPHLRREDNAVWLFDHLALLALQLGRTEAAAQLLGYVDAGRHAKGQVRDASEAQSRKKAHEGLQACLEGARMTALVEEGARLSADQADRLLLALAC